MKSHINTPSRRCAAMRGRRRLHNGVQWSCAPHDTIANRSTLQTHAKSMTGMTVAILGLGASGVSAAKLSGMLGADIIGLDMNSAVAPLEENEVLPNDIRRKCRTIIGAHCEKTLLSAHLVVVSPGVALSRPELQQALMRVPVVSEMAFAASHLSKRTRVTGITGTNGKSTTTEFTAQILQSTGATVWKGGNLGTPLSELACAQLQGHECEHAVVEVSSYQLEAPGTFAPDAACILNLTPDHLSRHGSMGEYARVKLRIFQHMRPASPKLACPSFLQYIRPDAVSYDALATHGSLPGTRLEGGSALIQLPGWHEHQRLELRELPVPGAHNKCNAAAAAFLALAVVPELTAEHIQPMVRHLEAPPHRMQLVADVAGLRWYDDSKATNVAAAQAAISCMDAPAVVLLGGQGKLDATGGLGFAELSSCLQAHRAVVTFGADGRQIAAELVASGIAVAATCRTLFEATTAAAQLARGSGARCVMLSPGCASFDEFRNYVERGQKYQEYVMLLTERQSAV